MLPTQQPSAIGSRFNRNPEDLAALAGALLELAPDLTKGEIWELVTIRRTGSLAMLKEWSKALKDTPPLRRRAIIVEAATRLYKATGHTSRQFIPTLRKYAIL